jgi:hypothetical protein
VRRDWEPTFLVLLTAAALLTGAALSAAGMFLASNHKPSQLDRIEQKLDRIEQRLGESTRSSP